MSGDPDVLEYYKNEHSKKPLRIINLNFCEQVDAGLTFNKKELQDSFVFDIKTSERTFYLVAETEADMNKWVQSICQICGFNQAEESTGMLRPRSLQPGEPALVKASFFGTSYLQMGRAEQSWPHTEGPPGSNNAPTGNPESSGL